ncbi:ABC transporter substrate-binding protein [Paenibacillus thermotolerans]|uniref:ABC transporter substrate-binding protein n=1 Tax=Paenibacillus thermotolerans TaxID=3027807 RepID=UPI002368B38F|nr:MULTISPECIES: ABC transporter substrate-binding protein [unclassified Paenibacillus]
MAKKGPIEAPWKKSLVMLLAVMLSLSVFLAGCGGSNGGSGGNGDKAEGENKAENKNSGESKGSGEKVTLTIWYWGGKTKTDFETIMIPAFEEKHPNIKVKYMQDEGGTDKLTTLIAGGTPPDVAILDRFMTGAFAAKGSLEDLTPYIATDNEIAAENYYPSTWAEGGFNGGQYSIPWGTDDRALYYNKTLMQEAGLDPNKPPTTTAELDAMAEKITKKTANGQYEQIGFIPWMNQGSIFASAWNFGGKFENNGELTPNDPQNVKALEWMANYAKKYDMAKINKFNELLGQSGINPFWTGKVGFVVDGNWILNDLINNDKVKPKFEWGTTPMPAGDGAELTTWSGGFSFTMPKGVKHPKESWELIKFITGYEGTLLWAKRPGAQNDISAMPKVNEDLKLADNPNLKTFLDMMPKAHYRPVSPAGQKLWEEMFRVQGMAIDGKGEPKKLLDEVKKNVDNELKKLEAQNQ